MGGSPRRRSGIVVIRLTDEDRYSVGVVSEVDIGQTYFLAVLIGPNVCAYGYCSVTCAGFGCDCQPFSLVEFLPGFPGSQVDVVSASAQGVVDGLGIHAQACVLCVFVAGDYHRSRRETAAVRIIFFILFSLNFTE